MDHGANINQIDNYGFFALKHELFQNNAEMMKRLLKKGANPDQTDEFGRTCLHLACNHSTRRDMKEIIKVLMESGANIQVEDMKKRTPLHYMFVRKNRRGDTDDLEPLNNGLGLLVNEDTKNMIDINH